MRIKPYVEILKLVWPLALGMVNNAAMQFADRAYLANASIESLEAILPATTLAWVFLGFFQSIVSYSGVFVAQYHGAGNVVGCVRSYHAGCWTAVLSSVLLLPLVPLGDWIFHITAGSPRLAEMEASYYDIVMVAAFFLMMQMAVTSYFTGRGKTRIVFWVNLIGNLLNVALDPLLIFGIPECMSSRIGTLGIKAMGIRGAAYATVIAQAVQFIILAIAAHREGLNAGDGEDMVFWRILRFGIPAGGYEILNMLSFTIFVFITGRMNAVDFAASNACFTINYLLFAPMIGFALGVQTLVGQARGRGDDAAARAALTRTLQLALGFVLIVLIPLLVLHRQILALFAPPDIVACEAFMSTGFKLLILMSLWILFDAADVVISGALKGAGDTRFVFWWMLMTSFAIWLPLVFWAFWLNASMPVMWSTMIVYVIVIMTGTWWRWKCGKWRSIDVVKIG